MMRPLPLTSSPTLSIQWTPCHPWRSNPDVSSSMKPALRYSLAELDALSSVIMLYISCHNLRWGCLSPPGACELIQHGLFYLWFLTAWHKAGAHCRSAECINGRLPAVRQGLSHWRLSMEALHGRPSHTRSACLSVQVSVLEVAIRCQLGDVSSQLESH